MAGTPLTRTVLRADAASPGTAARSIASTITARSASDSAGTSSNPAVPPSITSTSGREVDSEPAAPGRRGSRDHRPPERRCRGRARSWPGSKVVLLAGIDLPAGDHARQLSVALLEIDQDRAVDVMDRKGYEPEHQQEMDQSGCPELASPSTSTTSARGTARSAPPRRTAPGRSRPRAGNRRRARRTPSRRGGCARSRAAARAGGTRST